VPIPDPASTEVAHRRRRVEISVSLPIGVGKFPRSARALAAAVGDGDFGGSRRSGNSVSVAGADFTGNDGGVSPALNIRWDYLMVS